MGRLKQATRSLGRSAVSRYASSGTPRTTAPFHLVEAASPAAIPARIHQRSRRPANALIVNRSVSAQKKATGTSVVRNREFGDVQRHRRQEGRSDDARQRSAQHPADREHHGDRREAEPQDQLATGEQVAELDGKQFGLIEGSLIRRQRRAPEMTDPGGHEGLKVDEEGRVPEDVRVPVSIVDHRESRPEDDPLVWVICERSAEIDPDQPDDRGAADDPNESRRRDDRDSAGGRDAARPGTVHRPTVLQRMVTRGTAGRRAARRSGSSDRACRGQGRP